MNKIILAATGGLLWLGLTYLVVAYLIDKNCYIQTREIVYVEAPWILDDPSPTYGQAKYVQQKLIVNFKEAGHYSDSMVNKVIKDKKLNDCILLKVDSTYFEVLCQSGNVRGIDSYVVTPDSTYALEYRPIITIKKTHPE